MLVFSGVWVVSFSLHVLLNVTIKCPSLASCLQINISLYAAFATFDSYTDYEEKYTSNYSVFTSIISQNFYDAYHTSSETKGKREMFVLH